jgi:hypothetical protein
MPCHRAVAAVAVFPPERQRVCVCVVFHGRYLRSVGVPTLGRLRSVHMNL